MKRLFFFFTTILLVSLFTGCKEDPPVVPDVPDTPEPELTYTVTEVTLTGEIKVITLSWETKNATSCVLNTNSVELSGSRDFQILEDTWFYFVATGDGGKVTKSFEVKASGVVVTPPTPAPTITITANPDTLPIGGGTTILTWSATNTSSVVFNGVSYDSIGSVETGFITSTSNFSFTANGEGGVKTSVVTVTVLEELPPPTTEELLCNFGLFSKVLVVYSYTTGEPSWILLYDFDQQPPCNQDITMEFSMNPNKMIYSFGEYCPGEEGNTQIFEFDWWLEGMTIKGGGDRDIITLNQDSLVWIYESIEIQGENTTVPIFVKATYVHLQ
jgi:hypothetical protein